MIRDCESNDFLLFTIRDKKTHLFGNVVMARNTVELERDLYRVVKSPQSPYKDFETEYEVVLLGCYSLTEGILLDEDEEPEVYKDLIDIKNLNMNDMEVLKNV